MTTMCLNCSGRLGFRFMRRNIKKNLTWCFTFIAMFLSSNLYAEEIAVIVNETGLLTEISEADIREIYMGNIKFVKDTAVMPIHYKEGPVKDKFLSSIIGMNSKAYRLYWTKKVFQEGGTVPFAQDSFQLIALFVSKNKGAIGYVLRSELVDMKGIKVVTTIQRP